jgi:hypothetical protein
VQIGGPLEGEHRRLPPGDDDGVEALISETGFVFSTSAARPAVAMNPMLIRSLAE